MNETIKQDMLSIVGEKLPWQALKGKSFLVTGATGMIPGYIVKTLLFLAECNENFGMQIYALARNPEKAETKFKGCIDSSNFHLIIQDAAEPLRTKQRFDYIFHCASPASPKYFKSDPVGTIMPNVFGTYHLLEHAKQNKSDCFFFVSSPDVYGLTDDKESISENDYGFLDPLAIRSCYGESKRMAETLCSTWSDQYGIPVKIVRPFHVYGPGMNLADGRVFSDFVSNIVNRENILIKGQGIEYRTFCYLSDAISAIFHVLFLGKNGQAYNIGNEKGEIQIKELANLLSKLYQDYGIEVQYIQKIDKTYLKSPNRKGYPDTTKLKQLGWRAKHSIEEGFRRTVRSILCD